MADIAKSGNPSLASLLPPANCKISGLLAGEDIAIGDVCYIKTSDNKVYRSTGAAATAPAECDGMALVATKSGEAVTLIHDVVVAYGAGLSAGTFLYVSATAGALADAASTGGTVKVGRVIDATRILIKQSY